MISLSKKQSLRVILALDATTTELPVVCTYREGDGLRSQSQTAQKITTGDAELTILAGGAGEPKHVKFLSIVNVDTQPATVTLRIVDGATTRTLAKEVLGVGDQLFYSSEDGFYVLNSNGELKTTTSGSDGSAATSSAASAGLAASVASSAATSGGLRASSATSSATSAGLAASTALSAAVSAGT